MQHRAAQMRKVHVIRERAAGGDFAGNNGKTYEHAPPCWFTSYLCTTSTTFASRVQPSSFSPQHPVFPGWLIKKCKSYQLSSQPNPSNNNHKQTARASTMAGRNTGGRSTTSSYPSVRSATGANEATIVERCWKVQPPGTTPKAGLVIIHGGSWHSGWFGELGDLLSSPEYSIRVSAPDLPGHGLSGDPVPGYRYREWRFYLVCIRGCEPATFTFERLMPVLPPPVSTRQR